MHCPVCKANIESEAEVCPNCGEAIASLKNEEFEDIFSSSSPAASANAPEASSPRGIALEDIGMEEIILPKESSAARKRSKKWVAIGGIAIAAALIIFGAFLLSPARRIKAQLKKGEYKKAADSFSAAYDEEGGYFINRALSARLEELLKEYKASEREMKAAEKELNCIKKMGVKALDEEVKRAEKRLARLTASGEAYINGTEAYSAQNHLLAMKEYAKVIKSDPNYEMAKSRLGTSTKNYRNSALSAAALSAADGDYASAARILSSAKEELPKDKLIKKRLSEYLKKSETETLSGILSSADDFALKGDFASAIAQLQSALAAHPEYSSEEKYKKKLDYYEEGYYANFIEELEGLVSAEKYAAAGELIEKASLLLDGDEGVEAKREKLKGKIPDYLHSLTPALAEGWRFGGSAIDSFGTDHTDKLNYIRLSFGASAEYKLSSKYEKLTFFIASGKNGDKNSSSKLILKASQGGEFILKEIKVDPAKEPKKITFPLADCDSLSFEVEGENADIILHSVRLEY